MRLLILLSLVSCGTVTRPQYESHEYYTMQKHIIQGVQCPNTHYYSFNTGMCIGLPVTSHQNTPDREIKLDSVKSVQSSVKRVKRLKKDSEASNCVKLINKVRGCGIDL